ncbi:PREDICTED: uncharacterized protein LOC109207674 [Nicotiana attenuata]|uniref:uncharacterized protein LOC109207674 n=1 Tax=Nicotiana attenuata TaxID=49451 RepID=UPI000905BDF9|nr:PREDICTED: uncharacterized protein LOC109207674 [Nicotiana attenuata]
MTTYLLVTIYKPLEAFQLISLRVPLNMYTETERVSTVKEWSNKICATTISQQKNKDDISEELKNSEGGVLQVYYVKVLEKGDTYEIIERSLPKKPKLKKDPSVIEKEEMDKIGKYWINLVKKEIPKHHKIFINFHRKQLTYAKRFSETCQREVSTSWILLNKFVCDSANFHASCLSDVLLEWWVPFFR